MVELLLRYEEYVKHRTPTPAPRQPRRYDQADRGPVIAPLSSLSETTDLRVTHEILAVAQNDPHSDLAWPTKSSDDKASLLAADSSPEPPPPARWRSDFPRRPSAAERRNGAT